MLSYAFVINQWVTRMQQMQAANNIQGLVFYYGMIVKEIFFFPMPEQGSLTGDDTIVEISGSFLLSTSEEQQTRRTIFTKFR